MVLNTRHTGFVVLDLDKFINFNDLVENIYNTTKTNNKNTLELNDKITSELNGYIKKNKHIMELPCNFDHNGECLICDCWLLDCAYLRYINQDYSIESKEELENLFNKEK
jgi:hypothetical protein